MDTIFPSLENGTTEPTLVGSFHSASLAEWQEYFAGAYFHDNAAAQTYIYGATDMAELIEKLEELTSGYNAKTSETVWIHAINGCFMLSPDGSIIDVDTRTGALACFPIGEDVEKFRQHDTGE